RGSCTRTTPATCGCCVTGRSRTPGCDSPASPRRRCDAPGHAPRRGSDRHNHTSTSGAELMLDPPTDLAAEVASMHTEVARLRVENARLLRLLDLSPREAAAPGPAQLGVF